MTAKRVAAVIAAGGVVVVVAVIAQFIHREAEQRGSCSLSEGQQADLQARVAELEVGVSRPSGSELELKMTTTDEYDPVLDDFDRGYCLIADVVVSEQGGPTKRVLTAWIYDSERDVRNGAESLDPIGRAERAGRQEGQPAKSLPLANEVDSGTQGLRLFCFGGTATRCGNWLGTAILEGCWALVQPQLVSGNPSLTDARAWMADAVAAVRDTDPTCGDAVVPPVP